MYHGMLTAAFFWQEVVWEKLRDVHGNNDFARADFSSLNDRNEGQVGNTTGLATGTISKKSCQLVVLLM